MIRSIYYNAIILIYRCILNTKQHIQFKINTRIGSKKHTKSPRYTINQDLSEKSAVKNDVSVS